MLNSMTGFSQYQPPHGKMRTVGQGCLEEGIL